MVDGVQYMEMINWDDYSDYFGPVKTKDRQYLFELHGQMQHQIDLGDLVKELSSYKKTDQSPMSSELTQKHSIGVLLDTENSTYLLKYSDTV